MSSNMTICIICFQLQFGFNEFIPINIDFDYRVILKCDFKCSVA